MAVVTPGTTNPNGLPSVGAPKTRLFLPGYAGLVWNTARAAIIYAGANLDTKNLQQSKVLARAVAATLKNCAAALALQMTYNGLQTASSNLAEIIPLSLNLDPASSSFLNTRVNALQLAATSLQELLISPYPSVSKQLAVGQPAMPDPGYLEWLTAYDFETPPVGVSYVNLASYAQASATSWNTIASAMRQQAVTSAGTGYNTAILMGEVSQVTANVLANVDAAALLPYPLWNQFVAMPSAVRLASVIVNDPTDQVAQDTAVIRYVILDALNKFNALIVSLRQIVSSQLRLGTLRQGDTLMTFAARTLNDFTAWRQIAQINGLQPPYVSATPGPNLAVPGQQLFLSTPNTSTIIAPQTAPIASYINNYLGVDKFLGSLNNPMLPWTGDYQLISGYDNLRLSLGRRMQTTLGTLIYHSLFGSRIPPELGKIASSNELRLVEQYSISCLLSDPRVNKVVSCQATAGPNYSIVIIAVVLPNGLGQEEVTINEVIGPA